MLWQQCSSVTKLVIHSYDFCCKSKMWYPNKSSGLWDSWTPPVVFVSAALLINALWHTPALQSSVVRGAGLKLPSRSFLCRPMSETDSTAPHCSISVQCFHCPLQNLCWNLFLRQNWRNPSSAAEMLCGYALPSWILLSLVLKAFFNG